VRTRTFAAVAASAVVMLGAAACGSGSSGGEDNPTVAASGSSTQGSSTQCGQKPSTPAKNQQFSAEPKLTVAPAPYTATIVTNCGTIVATLDAAKAPHTVNSFAFLAKEHYFDATPCHRLTTAGIYVLQCGDPTGTGGGGPGYTIPDENLKGASYGAGTLAMANTGQPHTGGSQFFFCYADTRLPPTYTPFGTVVSGLAILKRIAGQGTNNANGSGDGAPNQPVVIESFTVVKG
jgi:peptidyl-prolyl cis-trans isomerase B (cyclophilin B)